MKVLPCAVALLALSGCAGGSEDPTDAAKVAACCPAPTTMSITVSDTSVGTAGRYEVTLEVANPGPETLTVVVRAVTSGASRWRPGQLDVAGGHVEQLTVVGRGPPRCTATPPWETGDLLLNGTPVEPVGDGWC